MQTPLYNIIGAGYDLTRRADPFIVSELARELRLGDGDYLDLACGTGNYTVALASLGGRWTGVDQSETMIGAAMAKSSHVRWELGNVDRLPFEDGTFTGATCILATHHFPSLDYACAEASRVLRSGRLVIFTSTPEQTGSYWLARYFPRTMEASCAQLPSLESTISALRNASMETVAVVPYHVRPDLRDSFLYSGKHRPEMYLDPIVRRGISTFASLADPAEIEEGCERLREDIVSGRIEEVMREYRSDEGDYCFVVAEKR